MIRTFFRIAAQYWRRIYVRVIFFAVLNLVAVPVAVLLGPFIPDAFAERIGAKAVDSILTVIASSMLAVTTFSLTIMTAAFANASSSWTPRSLLVLREDPVTHSALATFLGSYLFALVAIVLRAAGVFNAGGIVVLFAFTILVVVLVVVSIMRWIARLEGLGSLPFTAGALETRASAAMIQAAARPCHGGHSLRDIRAVPAGAIAVHAPCSGYVQQIYEASLNAWGDEEEANVFVVVRVGQYVMKGDVLLRYATAGAPSEERVAKLLGWVPVRDVRSFEQDPEFGVQVLAEVATRALSPGINDPGTAVDILHRLAHVLREFAPDGEAEPVTFQRLWCLPLDSDALFRSSFDPVARCAGDCVEVQIAVQHALARVGEVEDAALREAARQCAKRCRARAMAVLSAEADRAFLERCTG